ncbi:MAG: hypothetical protein K2N20_04775, partial [Helicobacter sp.]|nr:hypothetical protein [Helicobacter sp.]
LCQCSTALRLCYAFGSNIDVARCGWDVRKYEQWYRDVSASPQHDKIPSVIASERRERGNQPYWSFKNG